MFRSRSVATMKTKIKIRKALLAGGSLVMVGRSDKFWEQGGGKNFYIDTVLSGETSVRWNSNRRKEIYRIKLRFCIKKSIISHFRASDIQVYVWG